MFGYIRYDRDELKGKDYRKYTFYHCALCHALSKKCGFLYRIILSNDMTFLLICLDALSEQQTTLQKRCPLNPLNRISLPIDSKILDYTAGLNFYLMLRKIADNIQDTKSGFRRWILKRCYRFIARNQGYMEWSKKQIPLVEKLDQLFESLRKAESEVSDFDTLTNMFGKITGSFADGMRSYLKDEKACENLSVLLFNMGKWVYLADALDDYVRDKRKEEFNLLQSLHTIGDAGIEEQYVQISWRILLLIQKKMLPAYREITWNESQELIENVLFAGTLRTMGDIVQSRFGEVNQNQNEK